LFAKNLERLLAECCGRSDVSPVDPADMAERFESLRGYGRLPRGRENRGKRLSTTEIAAAILGLAPSNPKWAGHAAIILGDLRPVGGPSASFDGTSNLTAALERLLTESAAREALFSVMLSLSEYGVNSHGLAIVTYQQGDTRWRAFYVPKTAVSLLQPGMENSIDADRFHSQMSRSIGFSSSFFDQIVKAVEYALAFPKAPAGDGSEYDTEEAKQARYRALGVQVGSRFLNMGVDTQVTWPKNETQLQVWSTQGSNQPFVGLKHARTIDNRQICSWTRINHQWSAVLGRHPFDSREHRLEMLCCRSAKETSFCLQ
jgi:hypothetical protein